jgi:predicted Zn finger-like uncharacterized protein
VSTALKTRCPHCKSAFRVTAAQLDAAKGTVRCGVCFRTFNARNCLETSNATTSPTADDPDELVIDDNFDLSRLEELVSDDGPITANRRQTPSRTRNLGTPPPQQPGGTTENPLPAIPADSDQGAFTIGNDQMANWRSESTALINADSEVRESSVSHIRWLWLFASLFALLTLSIQLIYFNSLKIDRGSHLWSLAAPLCATLGCPVQPRTDPDSIVSGDLLVRTHPTIAGALFVDAVILNQSEFDQPFPKLKLSFEDLQGKIVAERTFLPAEYLKGELPNAALMPSNRPIKLEMEIVDPGKDAVSFRLMVEK